MLVNLRLVIQFVSVVQIAYRNVICYRILIAEKNLLNNVSLG